jgi:mono/diheme cytochrome c family protein
MYTLMILLALALIPPALIARVRAVNSRLPRIQLVQDMGVQPKFQAQQANPMFVDGRAMRPKVAGTVARGDDELREDAHYYTGTVDGAWSDAFPAQAPLSMELMRRGQERFNIYCAPCHGTAGYGDGMIHRRAEKIGASKWTQPTSLHDAYVRGQAPGQLYNTITHGIRNMPPYGHAIPEADRWAIVAYIKALQLSQYASVDDVPEKARLELP